jgi:hypothetical protein
MLLPLLGSNSSSVRSKPLTAFAIITKLTKLQRDSSLRGGRACLPRKLPLPGTFAPKRERDGGKEGRPCVQNDAA